MDIYLEELAKTIALHDPNCECRDCAIYYLLAEEETTNVFLATLNGERVVAPVRHL